MINKDSLLDAYMTLSGSPWAHMAMLITLFSTLGSPADLDDESDMKDKLNHLYVISIITHMISSIIVLAGLHKPISQIKFT